MVLYPCQRERAERTREHTLGAKIDFPQFRIFTVCAEKSSSSAFVACWRSAQNTALGGDDTRTRSPIRSTVQCAAACALSLVSSVVRRRRCRVKLCRPSVTQHSSKCARTPREILIIRILQNLNCIYATTTRVVRLSVRCVCLCVSLCVGFWVFWVSKSIRNFLSCLPVWGGGGCFVYVCNFVYLCMRGGPFLVLLVSPFPLCVSWQRILRVTCGIETYET